MQRHTHIARALYDLTSLHAERDAVAHRLATHASDVARCWAAQWVALSGLPLPAQLEAVRRFAADSHFGVREIAWMAVRDAVIVSLDEALALLQPWVFDADPNIRRFASELTRPRGVWVCADRGTQGGTLARIAADRAAASGWQPLRAELGRELAQRCEQDARGMGREAVQALGCRIGHRRDAVHREAGPADALQRPMKKARHCRAFCWERVAYA
jgi:hypothetical protein